MISAIIREPAPGHKSLWIIEKMDTDGTPTIGREISLNAVASYRELLGIDDPAEVVEALVHLQDNPEPNPDPVTGKNVYTDAYQLLRRREEARAAEAVKAIKEGTRDDPRSVRLRSTLAAYRAVHQPINGGECAMDRCRREARATLGIPDPARACGAASRVTPASAPEPQPTALPAMRGGKAQVLDLLADQQDYLLECTQRFLHQLSGHDTDHITPAPEPVPDPDAVILTADELLAKYGGAA